ncbi:MAG: protease pro-enzyme activation domain-containing protein [Terracidiphilus sp.]
MHPNRFFAAGFYILLALAALLAGSRQASSQASTTSQGNPASTPLVSSVRLAGHTAHQVLDGTAIRVSHYDPALKLRLVLAVQPPNMAAEEQFLQQLQTKGSPNFHKFLTAGEWNARFAPSVEDEQKVVDWAKSQGLTVTNRFANRLLVDVEAPVGVIEQVFGVTINNYQVGDEVDFANDRDPLIPASLSGIVPAVLGLNNIERMHGMMDTAGKKKGPDYSPGPVYAVGRSAQGAGDPTKRPSSQFAPKQPSAMAAEPASPEPSMTGGLAEPADIQSSQAYDYAGLQALGHCCNPLNNASGSPPGSSIGIVTFADFADSDVQAFFTHYGLAYNYTVYVIDGEASVTSPPGIECQTHITNSCPVVAPDDETTLDTEWSTASANSYGSPNLTAQVFVYEAANSNYATISDLYNFMLSDNHAKVLTTSYVATDSEFGSPSEMTVLHGIFNSMVGQGWTLISAAGDSGATSGCTDATLVFWPAEDPDFVAAGGTELFLNSDGTFSSEVAWTGGTGSTSCSSNDGGGGGGVSAVFPEPYWQNGRSYEEWAGGTQYVISSSSQRLLPDFSLNAAGTFQIYYYNGAFSGVGGTSIVAPELAGFFAQENAYLASIGSICGSGASACEPIGNPNPVLYDIGNNPAGVTHYPFYDITSGCDTNNITAANPGLTYYCATTGYDLATGWGSANMLQLAWDINFWVIPAYGTPAIAFSGPPTGASTWYNTNQTVHWTVTDSDSEDAVPSSGVAGYTQGWDSVPADPASEPHGGAGNSFYSGPQFPNAVTGCLAFNANSCAGGSGQGCHTVYVEGWDNQGRTLTSTYGPLCYDSVAPTIAINTSVAVASTGWFNSTTGSPLVSLVAADPGGANASGVKTTYGVLGTTSCSPTNLGTCQIYSGPLSLAQGANSVTAFSLDNAGNFSTVGFATFSVDTVPPVTTDNLASSTWNNGTSTTPVTVTLSATDAGGSNASGVQTSYYALDGGANTAYAGPFVILAAGSHTLKYWSVDVAGNTEAQNTAAFAIQSPTTAAIVATPNPSLLGQSVTITATVTATLPGTPTGSVTFWNGATNLGSSTLSGGVATLSTTALPLGALNLQASFLGSAYYAASSSPLFAQTVNIPVSQTITFTPITGTQYALTSVPLSATATSGLLVAFSSTTPAVCTVSAAVASLLTSGTCSIEATQPGNTVYGPAPPVYHSFWVSHLAQTITFPAITAAEYATTSMPISATASSGLAVDFASTTPTVCTVSGATASLLTSGTCTILATQLGNIVYTAATSVYHSFWVSHATQTITFPAITTAEVALTTMPLSATASSGLTVDFASTTPTVCTVSGATASLLTSGTCTILATQLGNIVYTAATSVYHSFWVSHATQTITFPAITTAEVALTTMPLSATASSGLTVAFASSTPTVCTATGATATLLTSGTCTIQATQPGNTVYTAATSVYHSFWVSHATQTINFPTIPPQTGVSSLPLTATASSGLTVAFASSTPTVCAVAAGASTASLLISGTCTIQATQTGNVVYTAAPSVSQSFTVSAP